MLGLFIFWALRSPRDRQVSHPAIRKSFRLSAELGKSSYGRNDNASADGVQGDRKENVKYRPQVEKIAQNIV
jgi:hypothetical protein